MKNIFLILLIALSAANLCAVTIEAVIETSMGDITLELYPDVAPLTVANFIAYANDDFYDGLVFHRIVKDFMVQGGGYDIDNVKKDTTYGPIQNESSNGLKNLYGTIAMARTAAADSATSEFFINHYDNSFLDLGDENAVSEFGYAVFGKVISGINIVDAIANTEVVSNGGFPPEFSVPVNNIIINDVRIIIPGDVNSDARVDLQDLHVMGDEWLLEGIVDSQWLVDPNETFGGEYGGAVAIYKDLAIVGAPGENNGTGAAYIFKNDGSEWILQTRCAMPEDISEAGVNFGFSVAIRDDHAIIGIPNNDYQYSNRGAIAIFESPTDPNEPWTLASARISGDGHAQAKFGYSLSYDNGILAVGAPGDNNNGTGDDSGAVYIFAAGENNYTQLAKFSGKPGDMLGHSVAIDDRVVAAGAAYGNGNEPSDPNSGAIHVFRENFDNSGEYPWYEEAVLTALDGAENDWLGYSVDFDNGTILAGATGVDDGSYDLGAVYVFDYQPESETDPNMIWEETGKLTAENPAMYDQFGWSVAIDGDYAIAGTKLDDDKGSNSGSAYLLKRDDYNDDGIKTWQRHEKLLDNNGQKNDYFGHAVAIDGNNAIVGAYGVDGDAINSGAAEMIYFKADADLNDDGIVNLMDFAIMASSWLGN